MDLNLADALAPTSLRAKGRYWKDRFVEAQVAVGQLQEKIAGLEQRLSAMTQDRNRIMALSVTRSVAEEARRRAAAGMRERAATLMEYPTGVPNAHSEAIRELADPRPKWSN